VRLQSNQNTPCVSERLRAARKAQGLTLKRAAEKIGCHLSYLSKLESDVARRPSADFLRKAAAVFQVNEHWLESGIGEARAVSSSEWDWESDLQAEREFFAAALPLVQRMTLADLFACEDEISQSATISPHRKDAWRRILGIWIGQKTAVLREFGVAQVPVIQNKWIMMADSRTRHWVELRRKILLKTAKRGARARLARLLKVTPQALNEWLQGRSAPPAEQTLRLLSFVLLDPLKNKQSAGSAVTRPAPKTRQQKAPSNAKRKSSQKKH
jgi:transcriptional regulator with XRE-family HTH domain